MSQGLDSSGLSADVDFGKRLGQALCVRPSLDVQQILNVASDLMGEYDSLLPALKVLATQPSLLALFRAAGTPAARPQFDAVLAFARETLAPAMVFRLEQVLCAASGLPLSTEYSAEMPVTVQGPPVPVTVHATQLPVPLRTPDDQIPTGLSISSDTVIARGFVPLAAEPGTVITSELRPSATQAPSVSEVAASSTPTPASGVFGYLRTLCKPLLLVLVLLFGFYGLLRSPWICESFDLCGTSDETQAEENALDVKPAAKTIDKTPANSVGRAESKTTDASSSPVTRPLTEKPSRPNQPLPNQPLTPRRPEPPPTTSPEEEGEPLW